MVEERNQDSLGRCEIIIAVVILLLLIGNIVLAILYKELWDMDQPLRDALALIRQFVETHNPSMKDKDGQITKLLKTWQFFRRALYLFAPEEVTWQTAFEECKKTKNASLVTVVIGEEQAFLDTEVQKRNREHWIGLRKNESLPYKVYWIDGLQPTKTYWDYDEPTIDPRYPEDCVVIGRRCGIWKCWQDRSCKELHPFICKKVPDKKWDN